MITLQYTTKKYPDSDYDIWDNPDWRGIDVIKGGRQVSFECDPAIATKSLNDVEKIYPGGHYKMVAYESGGGKTNTGCVCLITGKDGEKLEPITVFPESHYQNYRNHRHAAFSSQKICAITLYRWRRKLSVYISQYTLIGKSICRIPILSIEDTGQQEIMEIAPKNMHHALEQSFKKIYNFHCKDAVYYKNGKD